MRTHYDANDPHGNDMEDVLDPPQLNDLVEDLERSDIIYIEGLAYELESYGKMSGDGSRVATLRLPRPF